jgi:hypothetical protein
MRLTLRTMLAYMDDVLDPADAGELRHKIEESDFASGLVDRIRGVMSKLRMDAPKLDGKGMGNDANTIAEYLDSALEQDRVAEFERVCLESDKHLCEVAACHQILTIVLGKPADVPVELRERIYALGDPEKAAVHVPGPAATASHEHRKGAPPAGDNGRPAPKPAPLEVPEYLRQSRQSSVWPYVGMMAAALILIAIALRSLGPFDSTHPLARLFAAPEQIAQSTEEETGTKASIEKAAQPQTTTSEPGAAARTDAVAAAPTPSDASSAPTTPTPAERSTTESPDRIAAAPAPTTPPPATPETTDATPPAPTVATTTVPAAPAPAATTPPMVATLPKLPGKAPAPEPPPKPVEVGRYTSDGQLFATLDPADNLWYAKDPQEIITAGERLVVLPPYRPQIALPSAVQLIFAGEGALKMDEPDENRTPRVAVDYGRFIVATAGKAGAQVQLNLAGIKGLLTLVDADSELAIKVARWIPPGADPEVAENASVVVEMYNRNGRATWQQAEKEKVDIPARFVHVYLADLPPETHGPYYAPEWIDNRHVKPIDAETAPKLEKLRQVDPERPLVLFLQEAMKDRRIEVRALVARCLAALGEFEPLLKEFGDANQYSYWQSEFDTLHQALSRSPEAAAKIHQTINLVRSADANELYRLLWGYSDEQLTSGGAAQLVKLLEHDQLDIRVLAYVNLVSITGQFGSYRPERPKAQMKVAVADWGKRRDKGAIIHKGLVSPLDTYKPIVATDAKAGAAAPAAK